MTALPVMQRVKVYAEKLLNGVYGASVASILAYGLLVCLLVIFAMAIWFKAIGAPPLHPPQ